MRMPGRLLVLNAALIALAIVSVGYVVREFRAPAPVRARRPAPPAPPVTPSTAPAPEAPSGGYTIVASRNLFSPTRTEAPVAPTASTAPVPKPNLFGIILREGAPVAYLEDPTTKRVAGYRLGDSVAGGTVKRIGADHVVLNRPEGEVNVRLHDPSKPRPPAPPVVPTSAPGVPPPPIPAPPGTAPVGPPVPSAVPGPQPPLSVITPPTPTAPPPQMLPRRPLPPNLLRRLPSPGTDAPASQ